MKAYKKIIIITLILIVSIIIAICFGGIYKLKEYKVINIVPKYLLGMETEGGVSLNFTIDDTINSTTIYDQAGNVITPEEGKTYTEAEGYKTVEDKVNSDDKLNDANYALSKKIFVKRLTLLNADQYNIRQDSAGNVTIEIPKNDKSENIAKYLAQTGKFEIIDDETSAVLIDNNLIKQAVAASGQNADNTVALQIYFNEEGTKKLEEISKTYIETTVPATETTEATSTTKKISIQLDGNKLMTTYFGSTISDRNIKYNNGKLY